MQQSHSKQDVTQASVTTQIDQLKVIDDSTSRLEVANLLLAQNSRLDICSQLFIQLRIRNNLYNAEELIPLLLADSHTPTLTFLQHAMLHLAIQLVVSPSANLKDVMHHPMLHLAI